VLLLPPLGQEYKRCHKTLQKLAQDLATAGFHTLRFDYAGSGDSGELASWSLDTWRQDGQDALAWLRGTSGAKMVSAVGVRLGAAVALALDTPLEHLVLWDPVVDGSAYLESLDRLNRELLHRFRHAYRNGSAVSFPPEQLIGHPFPDTMRESLAAYSLVIPDQPPARHALWIDTPTGATESRKDAHRNPGAGAGEAADPVKESYSGHLALAEEFLHVEARCRWHSAMEIENVIMGQPVTRHMLQWFKQADGFHGNGA
jgi:pimeloyl-ACP methyl ester carboxylesterase